jgi:hypothetical protein
LRVAVLVGAGGLPHAVGRVGELVERFGPFYLYVVTVFLPEPEREKRPEFGVREEDCPTEPPDNGVLVARTDVPERRPRGLRVGDDEEHRPSWESEMN